MSLTELMSGANLDGAIMLNEELGANAGAVLPAFADSNKQYLTSDLCREEPVENHY